MAAVSSAHAGDANAADRFVFAQLALIGQHVTVRTKDGSVYSGVFHASEARPGGLAVTLRFAAVEKKGAKALELQPDNALLVRAEDFVEMTAAKVDLASLVAPSSDSFKTDGDISGRGGAGERNLQAVAHEWVSGGDMGALEDDAHDGGFDQFETNQRLTGKRAEFRESDYTTQFDTRDYTPEQKARASRVARSIQGTASSNMHIAEERGHTIRGDMDEEARYSGVLVGSGDALADRNAPAAGGSPGKYVPPRSNAKGGGAKGKPTKAGALNFRAALARTPAPAPAPAPAAAPKAMSAADMEAHMRAQASAGKSGTAPAPAPTAARGANIEDFKAFSAGFENKVAAKVAAKKSAAPAPKAAAPATTPAPQATPAPAPAAASSPAPAPAAEAGSAAAKPKKKRVFNVNAKPFDFDLAPAAPAASQAPPAGAPYYGGPAPGGMMPPGSMGYGGGYGGPPQFMPHPGAMQGYGMPPGGYPQGHMGGGFPAQAPPPQGQQGGRPPAFIPHAVPLPGAGAPYAGAAQPQAAPQAALPGADAARLAQASIAQSANRKATAPGTK